MTLNNKDIYEGNWHNETSGVGIISFSTGPTYKGSWVNKSPHGTGSMVYSNGSIYDGMWANGKPHGTGTIKDFQNVIVYSGQWINGFFKGSFYTNGLH